MNVNSNKSSMKTLDIDKNSVPPRFSVASKATIKDEVRKSGASSSSKVSPEPKGDGSGLGSGTLAPTTEQTNALVGAAICES